MMFGIGIIIAMTIFGGLLAFLGDRVGMKVGKKRLSIFGLRPKYTSMIITVLTGFFIAALTLGILTMMSEYARTAIFELQSLEQKLTNTTTKAKMLTIEVKNKESEYHVLNDKYLVLIADRQKAENLLKEKQAQYKVAAETLLAEQKELNLTQNQITNLNKIIEDLKNQITNTEVDLTSKTQQVQNLEGTIYRMKNEFGVIIDKPVRFSVGEILLAKIVEPGTTIDKVFSDVIEPLLKDSNDIALKRGAQIPGKSNFALRVNNDKLKDISKQLVDLKTKAVLRVVVEKNSVVGEPAYVTLELYPNQLLFKDDEVITENTFSSVTTESNLRDQLLSLLLSAYAKAIEKGIYTSNQNIRDLVLISDMMKTINLIKQNKDNNTKIGLAAVGDIYRIDPFKVKFTVISN